MTGAQLIDLIKRHPLRFGSVAIAVVFGLLTYLRSDAVATKQQELDQRNAEGDKVFGNVKNGANLKEQLDSLVAATREIEGRLVQTGELGLNLQYFYRLEAETGVHLTTLRQLPLPAPLKNAKPQYYAAVPYTVSAQGNFHQVLDFIGRLETGAHFNRLQSASLAKSDATGPGVITLNLQVELLGRP